MLKPIKKQVGEQVLPFVLHKQGDRARGTLKGEVRVTNAGITIRFDGYGDAGTQAGYGAPVFIEHYDGQLRVLCWADILKEDATHTIDMEEAREFIRKEGNCPACDKLRSQYLGRGVFQLKSTCPHCGHVETNAK